MLCIYRFIRCLFFYFDFIFFLSHIFFIFLVKAVIFLSREKGSRLVLTSDGED